MGTKNNPGQFDCYGQAADDEPIFILRGSDSCGWMAVDLWCVLKLKMRELGDSKISDEKLDEAIQCMENMKKWAADHGKDPEVTRRATCEAIGELV